ncbi:hypothetical protein F4779DRAFT_614474 [Xylariaceae sp. FL0662B]|nr:hypothetical protein F4779DRAFT_614474 [Xylariaceae sp. FL0662B]
MESNRQFHLFTRLPLELQLLIWDFYSASQPVVRHCFGVSSYIVSPITRRYNSEYVAFDEETRVFIDQSADPDADCDIYPRRKLSLGPVCHMMDTRLPPYTATGFSAVSPGIQFTHVPRAHAWANLDRDIFFFFTCPPVPLPFPDPRDSLFVDAPWIGDVRRLALAAPRRYLRLPLPPLTSLTRLREVSIVVATVPAGIDPANQRQARRVNMQQRPYAINWPTPDRVGFVPLVDFAAVATWNLDTAWASAECERLKRLFREQQMRVEVRVVVDLYPE